MKINGRNLEHGRLMQERFLNDITLVMLHNVREMVRNATISFTLHVDVCCLFFCDILSIAINSKNFSLLSENFLSTFKSFIAFVPCHDLHKRGERNSY